MARTPIYMDNHATTRVDPRVVEAMLPYFTEKYGNAASVNHRFGWEAADAVAAGREQVAALLNVPPRSLIFTSGATESNNIALKGVMHAAGGSGHLVTNAAEHRAVLVSVMAANNEVGTINPITEIGRICRERGVLLHCDAVQAIGKLPVDLSEWPVDLASLTAHKLYGPKGIGALYVRRGAPRIRIEPLFDGGGHENHRRSGTLAVPLIVGFGRCCQLAGESLAEEAESIAAHRDRLWHGLRENSEGVWLNGHPDRRLPGNLNVSVEGVDGEALMMSLKDLAVSSGSACTSADPEPSHVLRAMGVSEALTRASLRFGLGRFNTRDEVEAAIAIVVEAVARLRRLSKNGPG